MKCKSRFAIPRFLLIYLLLSASLAVLSVRATAQDSSNDCKAIHKQINDQVDKLPELGKNIGEYGEKLEDANREIQSATVEANRQKWISARNSWQSAIESTRSQIRKTKVNIDSLLDKLCDCCAKKSGDGAKPEQTGNNCEGVKKQINDQVDKLPELGKNIGEYSEKLEDANREIQSATVEANRQKWISARNSWQSAVESTRSQIRKTKVNIDSLLGKLCDCCAKETQQKKAIEKKKLSCDLEFGYDYMRAPDESAKNLNGFGGSLFCNVKPWIAVGGDFSALFGSTTDTVGTTKFDVSLHRQTYLFGPQFNIYPNDKVTVFFKPLIGGVHDTGKTTFGTSSTDFSASAFAMSFGGGVDIRLNDHFAIRPFEFKYTPTHFGGEWQNNFGVSTGLVFRFGGR